MQCQGWLGGQLGKCKSNIKNIGIGIVAPSFWGFRHDIIKQKQHERFHVSSANLEINDDVYEVHIATNPLCMCRDFADRAA